MKQLFTRIFSTNPFTTLGGLMAAVAVVLLVTKQLGATEFLALIGSAVTIIGLASKDGVRQDVPVAREDVGTGSSTPTPPSSSAAAVLLLFAGALFGLAACTSQLNKPVGPPLSAQYLISDRLHVTPFSPAVPVLPKKPVVQEPVYEATPDSLVPPAAYLVAPPAHLSPRERRKFLRAQRKALIEAARTVPAKVKQGSGSSYAPAGTAITQNKPQGPTVVGHDNATTAPRPAPPAGPVPGLFARAWSKICEYGVICVLVAVFVLLGIVRFSPFGRGLRAAAAAARTLA